MPLSWFEESSFDAELHVRTAGVELGGALIFAFLGEFAYGEGVETFAYVIWAMAALAGAKGLFDLGRFFGINEIREEYGPKSEVKDENVSQ